VVVVAGAALGVVAGLVWHAMAPPAAQVEQDPDLAIGSDVQFGAVMLVAGALLGLVASWWLRPHGEVLVVGVALGGLACAGMALVVGGALGAAPLRALALVLAAPIGGLLVVVAVGVTYGLGDDLLGPRDD